ncbi:Mpo1-like protein [Silanimonas sp.]|jgi:hypothetical protein|uniref:Mpo1-like protein n=1 Tax=Silanimonas sp. TaxID=1929290 RepID=UPI0022C69035|nr:Mpo1-like protein [Silanimonas sp.]MCZ8063007.1 DUF962 domain-containing protein [Silanimonas sp.]
MGTEREGGLLAWQFRDYAERHQDKLNLWLHLYAVPAFIAGTLAAALNLLALSLVGVVASLSFVVLAFLIQGLGHKREASAPVPFDGPGDFLKRVFAEQFVTFPRFVLSGGWMRNVTRPAGHH